MPNSNDILGWKSGSERYYDIDYSNHYPDKIGISTRETAYLYNADTSIDGTGPLF